MRPVVLRVFALTILAALLAACGSQPARRPPPDPDYTPGGLYKPGVLDGGPAIPPDIAAIPEPVPRVEPLSRYGNRSPYTVLGRSYRVLATAEGYVERGIASWYGEKFHGRATSSLEPYDMYRFSAAHRSLPLPSYVRVTNLENGRSVVVRVNDRGPFHGDRLIDLSYVAAAKLDILTQGVAEVEVRALTPGEGPVLADAPTPVVPAPRPDPAMPDFGRTWLQVGAFRDRRNADDVQRRLLDAGVDRIELSRNQGEREPLWRVRVGPLAPDAVQRELERLLRLGFDAVTPIRE